MKREGRVRTLFFNRFVCSHCVQTLTHENHHSVPERFGAPVIDNLQRGIRIRFSFICYSK
jgi:hypothetical protein